MIGSKIIANYKNGNYHVLLTDNGTKIRYNNAAILNPEFPESIDCKISNRCNMLCPMCHEQSTPDGVLANLNHPLFDSLPAYTELALGGGSVLEHPDLISFLERMLERHVICNMTLHLSHFEQAAAKVKLWHDNGLIHGVGISINTIPTDYQLMLLRSNSNFVMHCIAGVVPHEALEKMYDCGLKLLILGYKNFGRGCQYQELHPELSERIAALETKLPEMRTHFKLISFDNLALEQLHIRKYVSDEVWEKNYMGDDGDFTMYLDMVEGKYAKSSTSERKPLFSNNIIDLFNEVRRSKNG